MKLNLCKTTKSCREGIIREARSWLGTAFHHQGRIKKADNHLGGCDCFGLFLGVAQSLNLKTKNGVPIHEFDQRNYSETPQGDRLKSELSRHLLAKDCDNISPGDLALFSISNTPQHLAIIGDIKGMLTLIHAYSVVGYVCEHSLDLKWRRRLVSAYQL